MSSSNTVYFVTGANRGIGLGMFETLLARQQTTVIGTARNKAAVADLKASAEQANAGSGSKFYLMEFDFSVLNVPDAVRARFDRATEGLDHVDVVICSAGFATPMATALETKPEDLLTCVQINTIGPLAVFQGLWPLMQKNPAPKFIVLSSSVGSIGGMEPLPGGAYGPSKAAVNYLVKALHVQMESQGLISIAVHPGWVKTSMGERAAEDWAIGMYPPVTVEDSVRDVMKVIDDATRQNYSGRLVGPQGQLMEW